MGGGGGGGRRGEGGRGGGAREDEEVVGDGREELERLSGQRGRRYGMKRNHSKILKCTKSYLPAVVLRTLNVQI